MEQGFALELRLRTCLCMYLHIPTFGMRASHADQKAFSAEKKRKLFRIRIWMSNAWKNAA